ncbi:MAG: hypothetical protein V7L05_27310 [Nostoc sp.]|uniref:hypothetical protein n=1 Tax=Nostoc sp. TaxID=1180 RepID=UPI002FF6FD64
MTAISSDSKYATFISCLVTHRTTGSRAPGASSREARSYRLAPQRTGLATQTKPQLLETLRERGIQNSKFKIQIPIITAIFR